MFLPKNNYQLSLKAPTLYFYFCACACARLPVVVAPVCGRAAIDGHKGLTSLAHMRACARIFIYLPVNI